jgi:hypothetical protein
MTAAVQVNFPGYLATVEDLAALRAVPTTLVEVPPAYLVAAGGLTAVFVWDATSLAADDGSQVIKPDDKTLLQAGRWIGNYDNDPPPPTTELIADGVALHSYPGTTVIEDPNRWDHNNVQLANALADTRNPASPNFGKWVDIHPFKGAGTAHADEAGGADDPFTDEPIDPKFLARAGDTLIDCFSQNGKVPDNFPISPIFDFNATPGNLVSGARIRLLPGARVRRAPRTVIRPLILCGDPNSTPATTDPDTGIDTQSDVYRNIEIICLGDAVFLGENHRWGYREHHNDISLNGATEFRVITRHLGTMSDALYIGAGNIGGGLFNRHNKNGYIDIFADGRNQNNRNVVSVIDCVGLRGKVRGYNFTKSGGPGNDPFNPNSGTLAPGVVDVEPNAFTDDPRVDDIELDVYAEDCGSSAVATLLIDNNVIPNPLGSMRFTGRAVRCKHGKHTLIGAVNMRTPYQIHVRMDAIDCESPFEVLAGQGCTHEGGRNLRSQRAGLIGFTGFGAPQDFRRVNEIDQELGAIDSGAIQVRGWNGGGIFGGQMINAKTRGYHILSNTSGSPIRDLTISDTQFVNRADITSQSMLFAWDVDPSNGGPQINPATIIERDVSYNGIASNNWAVQGSRFTTVPLTGTWPAGVTLEADPSLEPGAPERLRTIAANAVGSPPEFWPMGQIPHPFVFTGATTVVSGAINSVGQVGTFGSQNAGVNARAERPATGGIWLEGLSGGVTLTQLFAVLASGQSASIIFRAPWSGERNVAVGFITNTNRSVMLVHDGLTKSFVVSVDDGPFSATNTSFKFGEAVEIRATRANTDLVVTFYKIVNGVATQFGNAVQVLYSDVSGRVRLGAGAKLFVAEMRLQ